MDGEDASDASGEITSLRQRRPYVTALAWLAVIPFAGWAAIRIGGWERDALVPLFAFTPDVAPVAVVAAAGAGAVRRWAPATVGGFAAVALIAAVVPRSFPGPRPPDPSIGWR